MVQRLALLAERNVRTNTVATIAEDTASRLVTVKNPAIIVGLLKLKVIAYGLAVRVKKNDNKIQMSLPVAMSSCPAHLAITRAGMYDDKAHGRIVWGTFFV